jgi:3-phenylpropionate/trans-cinnamate dioxygenase ferredoxin reductase subunit
MHETIVIAGAGHASGQVIATLKQNKFEGRIVLVGDEAYLPYQRPPLSKKFLAGELPADRLAFKPPGFYDDPNIEIRLNTRIERIDPDAKCLHTSERDQIDYDKLIIALGTRVRELSVDGAELDGIHYLRTIEDVDGIRAGIEKKGKLVIIGAGYIGLEVAAVSRKLGVDVTVVEMADRVMSRVVSPQVSDFYQQEHTANGVKLILSTGLTAFRGAGCIESVELSNGDSIAADFVIVGIGVIPNTELAEAAGLRVDNGIVVDDQCRTSDPNIYAIGDCTSHPNEIYARRLRLESVHNALEQAKTAASNLCGRETHYSQVPWFWSDQYDLKLQIAGLSEGFDQVVIRGEPANRSFACLYLSAGKLIAVDAINAPRDFVQSKALIAEGAMIDREKLADTNIALKDLA